MQPYTDEQISTGEWVRKITASSQRGWKAFYHTTAWQKKRAQVLQRDHGACQRCREKGKYTKADTVHHIRHLRDVPELALTDDNLISLCSECHEAVHPEKHKTTPKGYTNIERWQ